MQKNVPAIHIYLLSFLYLFFTHSASAGLNAQISSGEELKLIGIGMHKELRNDIYLGALFVPQSVDNVEQITSDNVAKRMSLRFVTKYSDRKVARHFKERLALNNPRNEWQPLTREIVQFSRIFKQDLEPGDEINIDHIPGKGTEIYLNGTLFQTINKPGFSQLLLNIWLGSNPPTKAFKQHIRGDNQASAQATFESQYMSNTPTAGKFDSLLQSKEPTQVAANKSQINTTAKKQTNTSQQPAKKKPVTPKTVDKKTTTNKKVANTTKKPVENQSKTIVKKPETKKPDESSSKIANNKSASSISVPDLKIATPIIAKPDLVATLDKSAVELPEDDLFDADLVSGSYSRDLVRSVDKYKKYPKQALIDGDEGTVGAKAKIDANGEIIDVVITDRSGSRTLDRAVVKMIKRAAPYEPIPKGLELEEFEFDVLIEFKL
jgi:periplasmic protein TonB